MNHKKLVPVLIGAVAAVIGLIMVFVTRGNAIAENAADAAKFPFAISLIVMIVGIVILIAGLLPERKPLNVRTLATAAMFAALCYIGFAFLKIDIPVGTEKTAFHLGNVFCVLAALFLGGLWGGMSGAVGLTIADLTSGYVTSAPKTFLLKLGIGLIAGAVAHHVFHLSKDSERRVSLPVATVISCAAGMLFNIIADPLVGYFYKMYVLGIPQDVANVWVKMGAVTTLVNGIVAIIAASALYLALRPALKRTKLIPEL